MRTHDFNQIITKLREVFTVEEDTNDHYFYHVFYQNKYILKTKRSHSGIKDRDIPLIAKQLGLSVTRLNDYKRCNLANDEYLQILRQKGKITEV